MLPFARRYNRYDVFFTINRTVKKHWYSDTNVYLKAQHFIAYMKVSKEKLFKLRMIEFLLVLASLE